MEKTKVIFDITLSKNIIARELKRLYKANNEKPPEFIKFHFDEIEKLVKPFNQPTGRDVFNSNTDI